MEFHELCNLIVNDGSLELNGSHIVIHPPVRTGNNNSFLLRHVMAKDVLARKQQSIPFSLKLVLWNEEHEELNKQGI